MDRASGFTIVELMMGIVILGILTLIAVPNFQDQIRRSAVKKVQEDLYADLIFTRSESIARARGVTICPVANVETDTPSCSSNATDWNNGWMVFTDTDKDGNLDNATSNVPADEIIRFYANSNKSQMALSFNVTGSKLKFNSRGLLHSGNGTFTFCDSEIAFSNALIISRGAGRVRYSSVDAQGDALSCS